MSQIEQRLESRPINLGLALTSGDYASTWLIISFLLTYVRRVTTYAPPNYRIPCSYYKQF